jgi:hypothetical protein
VLKAAVDAVTIPELSVSCAVEKAPDRVRVTVLPEEVPLVSPGEASVTATAGTLVCWVDDQSAV